MTTRTKPLPRVAFRKSSEVAHYRLTDPTERAAFAALREKEARGEIEIDSVTWPPQIDHKGIPHVTVLYWNKVLMREEEIEKEERRQLQKLVRDPEAARRAAEQSAASSPPSSFGLALTDEEKELLAPYKGPVDD